jgi:hypothetical protein
MKTRRLAMAREMLRGLLVAPANLMLDVMDPDNASAAGGDTKRSGNIVS